MNITFARRSETSSVFVFDDSHDTIEDCAKTIERTTQTSSYSQTGIAAAEQKQSSSAEAEQQHGMRVRAMMLNHWFNRS